ncbi:AAA family ATPase [Arthrobacter echini]|uniref:AAA family ATPase n=1 Tax=Arthrobacter echini TaxID=1529066 RepID=A0A5D0XJG3_9MICC|nr:AAA family ATPase [Arthrobacter echini]TYC96607.1 AAA family ATPase [Arthrobacter echini]
MTASILALCNQKGGVGKSTTAFHLARSAVTKGLRVLVVDADPQGNITSVLTDDVGDDVAGLADVLSARASETISDVAVNGIWERLTVVPTAGETLGVVRDELVVAGAGREARLRDALHLVREDYDLILIDCAPSLDTLTINGLTAADGVIVVTQSKLWSANGLAKLLDTIAAVQAHYNPQLSVAGILVNQHEARTVGGAHWVEQIQEATTARGLPLLQPPVPKRALIADATESARGLDELGADGIELARLYDNYLSALMGRK